VLQQIVVLRSLEEVNSMLTKNRHLIGFALALVVPFFLALDASADENDPPSRAARLAYAEGSVSFQPGGTQDWVAAAINRPLTTGDQLWADRDSRAELQLDGSTLRLAGSTSVSLLNLGDSVTQVQLSSGTLLVRVRRLDDNETYEIDTPNLAFSILRPGLYRLSVDASGASTTIHIRSGQGEVTGGGAAYVVRAGEDDVFSGTDQLSENMQSGAAEEDSFDAWSASRDDRWEHSVSARYVSPDVVGYEDLDNQGVWRPVPEYGTVWFPNQVEAGWAPYHYGHWSYIAPWGYTWVDEKPWGFAPFHYGRWVWTGGAWGWIPAPPRPAFGVYVRPVYAPALVAWVGVGAGVAWFALGPREVYVPCYPVSRRYVNNINVSNTTVNTTVINNVYNTTIINNKTVNVTNVNYANRHVPGAVAAVSSRAFNTAQPVSRNLVRVDQRELSSAPVRAVAPATVPTKQAVLGSARVVTARPPLAVQTRAVVARTAPPPPPPTFERREQAIQANAGKPLSVPQVQQLQAKEISTKPPVRIAPAATPVLHGAPPAATNLGGNRVPPIAVHPKELPPVPKPVSPGIANSALEREHLQQQQQMLAQQEQARQRIQQQQDQAHQQFERQQADAARRQQAAQEQQQQAQQLAQQQQRAQQDLARQQQARQQADDARRQQLEQQHQQQTQQLAQQHAQEQEQLQKRQQEERRTQESQTKAAGRKPDRPPNPR
jgi:hypothetical protein